MPSLTDLMVVNTRASAPLDANAPGDAETSGQVSSFVTVQSLSTFTVAAAVLKTLWELTRSLFGAGWAFVPAWLQAKRVTSEMHRTLQRETIKLELLREAARTLDRAALLLEREGRLESVGAFGQAGDGRPLVEALQGVNVEPSGGSPLARSLGERTAFVGPVTELGLGDAFVSACGRPKRDRGVLVPLPEPVTSEEEP